MKQKIEYFLDGVALKNLDEYLFAAWLKEAKQHKVIADFHYCGNEKDFVSKKSFQLSEKVYRKNEKGKLVELKRAVEYTPDFMVWCSDSVAFDKFDLPHDYLASVYYIDVKGTTQQNMRSVSTSVSTFPVKQAWLYKQNGIWVAKVITDDFLRENWCPNVLDIWSKQNNILVAPNTLGYVYSRYNGLKLYDGTKLVSDEKRRRK